MENALLLSAFLSISTACDRADMDTVRFAREMSFAMAFAFELVAFADSWRCRNRAHRKPAENNIELGVPERWD